MGRDGVPHFSPCSAWCKTPFGFEIGKQKHRAGGRTRYMVPRIQFKRSGTAARRTVFPLPTDRQKVYYSHGADLCHVGPYQENILPYKDSTMPVWELTLILRDDIIILCQQTVNGDRVVAWSYNRLWKMLIDKKMKRTDLLCIYQHENIIPYPARFQSTLPMRGATVAHPGADQAHYICTSSPPHPEAQDHAQDDHPCRHCQAQQDLLPLFAAGISSHHAASRNTASTASSVAGRSRPVTSTRRE